MSIKRLAGLFVMTVIVGVLVFTVGCITIVAPGGGLGVAGSGTLETREMDFTDFTKVKAGYACQIDITRAASFFVSITLDDNLFEYLDAKVVGDTLYIGLEPNRSYRNYTHRATVTMPRLLELELSGASRGDVSDFSSTDSLRLEASGASTLSIDDLEAGDTRLIISGASRATGGIEMADGDFEVSGASTVELDGNADDVSLEVSGASTARLADFTVANADTRVSGASTATVNVSGILDIDVSGASTLYYVGNPTLGRLNVTGGSRVSQR
jgi:hypothetical protein